MPYFLRLYLPFMLLFACALRFAGLSDFYFNPDEMWNLVIASQPSVKDVIAYNLHDNAHPPLLSLIVHGMLALSRNEIFLRSVSLLPSLLLIPLFSAIGSRFIGKAGGIFLVFLSVFSATLLINAAVIRQYSLFMLLITASVACILFYLRTPQRRYLAGYGVFMFLALLSHYTASLVAAGIGLVMMGWMWKSRIAPRTLMAWMALHAFLAVTVALHYYFQIWTGAYGPYDHQVTQTWMRIGFPQSLLGYVKNFLLLLLSFSPRGCGMALFMLCFFIGLTRSLHETKDASFSMPRMITLFFLTAMSLNLVLTALLKVYPFAGTRHCIYLLPFAFLIAASGAEHGYRWFMQENHRIKRHVLLAVLGIAVLVDASNQVRTRNFYRQKHSLCEFSVTHKGMEEAFMELYARMGPNDIIVTEKQTTWYLLYKEKLQPEILSPQIARLQSDNHSFYYPNTLGVVANTFFTAEDVASFLGAFRPFMPKYQKIWFLGVGCNNTTLEIMQGRFLLSHPALTHLRDSLGDKYMHPTNPIGFFSVPSSALQSYLANAP